MTRNHQRMSRPAKLNLVALMDIFTILVLFLMVNNGDVEVLQADRSIELPESVSEQRPEAAPIVKITGRNILFNDEVVLGVEAAVRAETDRLPELSVALEQAALSAVNSDVPEQGRAIVIMGDEKMVYSLLTKVMATCAGSEYRDISLAVNSAPLPPGELIAAQTPQVALPGGSP